MKKKKRYENTQQAITDLHHRGFVYDFQFDGKNIIWVQEKLSIPEGNYAVIQRHDFTGPGHGEPGLSILAIAAFDHSVKGILMDHSGKRSFITKTK
jgi:hypothetical protein